MTFDDNSFFSFLDTIQDIKNVMFENRLDFVWKNNLNFPLMFLLQSSIDPTATPNFFTPLIVDWMLRNRAYFKNNSGADIDIEYDGEIFTILDASTYCASQNEAAFIINEAANKGLVLLPATQAEFGINGVVQVFFE